MVEVAALTGGGWCDVGQSLSWLGVEMWVCMCGDREAFSRSGSVPAVKLSKERCEWRRLSVCWWWGSSDGGLKRGGEVIGVSGCEVDVGIHAVMSR